jgi:hypothetical protein
MLWGAEVGDEASFSLVIASRVVGSSTLSTTFRKHAKQGRADRTQADTWTFWGSQCLNG